MYLDHQFELNSELKAIVEMTGQTSVQKCIPNSKIAKQVHALWAEVLACYKKCWQKIAISTRVMFENI